jgi:hypothetical protein
VEEVRARAEALVGREHPQVHDPLRQRARRHEVTHQLDVALAAALGRERVLALGETPVVVALAHDHDTVAARAQALGQSFAEPGRVEEQEPGPRLTGNAVRLARLLLPHRSVEALGQELDALWLRGGSGELRRAPGSIQ